MRWLYLQPSGGNSSHLHVSSPLCDHRFSLGELRRDEFYLDVEEPPIEVCESHRTSATSSSRNQTSEDLNNVPHRKTFPRYRDNRTGRSRHQLRNFLCEWRADDAGQPEADKTWRNLWRADDAGQPKTRDSKLYLRGADDAGQPETWNAQPSLWRADYAG